MTETFYDVLGVDQDADQKQIKRKYREKLSEYHPDVSTADNPQEMFYLVKEANRVLSDEQERSKYDRLGHETYVEQEGSSRIKDIEGADGAEERTEERRNDADTASDRGSTGDGSQSRSRSRDRDHSDSRRSERGSDHRSGDGWSKGQSGGGGAAEEYRERRRRSTARSRSDRTSRRRTSSSSRSGRERSGGSGWSGDGNRSTSGGDPDGASTDTEQTTQDDFSQGGSRGFGQPTASGMFVSPDIELLRFPLIAVLYFIAFEFSAGPFIAVGLLGVYHYYRQHKFTERLLTEDLLEADDLVGNNLQILAGTLLGVAGALAFAVLRFGGVISFSYVAPAVVGALVVAAVGVTLTARAFAKLVLYDWVEQRVKQPVIWDTASRVPAIATPLLLADVSVLPFTGGIVAGLLLVSSVLPLLYVLSKGRVTGIGFIDGRKGPTSGD